MASPRLTTVGNLIVYACMGVCVVAALWLKNYLGYSGVLWGAVFGAAGGGVGGAVGSSIAARVGQVSRG
jgi:hypothetical protein